ncbi:hypothetical protein [Methylobacterium variabile]|jgi:hypothetical protein|uniref:hypothetical protein n=1 Tax=Methylobacterium variabile TaxID=298794 RepID=UPI000A448C1B|nr:hypothetical protein [Methylobacterium variabile]
MARNPATVAGKVRIRHAVTETDRDAAPFPTPAARAAAEDVIEDNTAGSDGI